MKLDDTGDGLRMLQEHLGHANFNTTAKYRKISGEEHKDWYQKLWQNEVKPENDANSNLIEAVMAVRFRPDCLFVIFCWGKVRENQL